MRVLLVDPIADLLPSIQPAIFSMPELELYCAPDGPTAIQHAGLLGGVDVLITEVFLPGADGLSVQTALREATPSLITVFLTRHGLGSYAEAVGDTPVFEIPVDPESFAQAFRRYLRKQKSLQAAPPEKKSPPQRPADAKEPQAGPSPPPREEVPRASGHPPEEVLSGTAHAASPLEAPTAAAQTPPVLSDKTSESQHAPAAIPQNFPPPAPPVPPQFSDPSPPENATPPQVDRLSPGSKLGSYQILREDGAHPFGRQFAAVHMTLNRAVHLVVMDEESAEHAELQEAFLSDARAKAKVHHPALLAVYEAGEVEGVTFCAAERIDSNSLESLLENGLKVPCETIIVAAKTVAEGVLHLRNSGIPHLPLTTEDILISVDGSIRLQNIALGGQHPAADEAVDLALLGEGLLAAMPADAPDLLRKLLERTLPTHPRRLDRWEPFLVALAASQFPNSARRDTPTPKRQPVSKKRISLILALLALLGALGVGVLQLAAPEPLVPRQSVVPGGQFLVANNKKIALQSFSIDSTEVTNRQYFQFVNWIRKHPNEATRFDHPEQPARHSHIPPGWAEMFPEKAPPEKSPQNPQWDFPVVRVAWWDAFAFAAWAGRELPTDEEWEAAGRGPRGLLFPWGDEPEAERTNIALPEFRIQKGELNAPVSVLSLRDSSTFGVTGLAGNVSEWTAVRKDGKALVKGGHFNAPLLTLDASSSLAVDTRSPQVGFRTLSRKTIERP
jgi:CheY-like chemotaxis protein